MAAPTPPRTRRPPGLYRLARALRRVSVVIVVLLLLFLATVGYSAFELVRSSPQQSGGYSAGFDSNDTISVTGSLSVSNPGWYPLSGFTLSLRILNASGVYLGEVSDGPVTLAAGATTSVPIALYLPVAANGAAESLLVQNQYLDLGVWGNATYAYLFPVSVHFDQNKSWGAPFSDFSVSVGTPSVANGSTTVPVTISYSNDASFAEAGSLGMTVRSSGGTACGGATYPLNVAPQSFYYETRNVTLATGCSIAGGSVVAVYSGNGVNLALPPEPLP